MDPTATTAGLIALAIGLVKIVEKLVEWVIKKMSPDGGKNVVQLDPEMSRMVQETHARVVVMADTMSVKDGDGVPMVYSSRVIADDVRSTAMILKDISYTQQKLLDRLESLDERVSDVQTTQRAQSRR